MIDWDGRETGAFKRRLLAWYHREKREMPWRETNDPYRILLSEFMLQQTQVETVIPYYERFVERFPTVHDLASADLDDVLRLWEGLGYYSRARNLHRAAVAISDDHGGTVPRDYDDLIALPGFGPYTTAAVLSIAYGEPHAVLDGNVIRVLARLTALKEPTDLPAVRNALQGTADALLNRSHPGDHNQAMMELGATVCKRRPLCADCPVAQHCRALAKGLTERLPIRSLRKPRPERVYVAGIIRRTGSYLIARRRPEGLLGGLWEFPAAEVDMKPTAALARSRLRETLGVDTAGHRPFRVVRHAYTHFGATVHAYRCDARAGEPVSDEHDRFEWVSREDLPGYAYSRIARKLVNALTEAPQGGQTELVLEGNEMEGKEEGQA